MSEILRAGDIQVEVEGLSLAGAAAILAERGRHMRAAPAAAATPGTVVLRWSLGGESFALPLAEIAQVVPLRRLSPVPGAPPALLGLASVRRRIVNVMDVSRLLGLEGRSAADGHLIVLKGPVPRIALLVDRAEGVETLPADFAPPDGLTAPGPSGENGPLTIVDKGRLVEALGLGPARQGD